MSDAWVTQVGEAFAGEGPDAAHVNTVLGRRGGPVKTAWTTALATPRIGQVPFVVVLRPNLAVQPPTLFVNEAPLSGERQEHWTWGAAQAGVADAVVEEVVPAPDVDSVLLVAAVWVSPAAGDARRVYEHNRSATTAALRAGAAREPSVRDVLDARGDPTNPYFAPST
jgi:5,6,7,8-tetrahydromethanopterin hydro-lyase